MVYHRLCYGSVKTELPLYNIQYAMCFTVWHDQPVVLVLVTGQGCPYKSETMAISLPSQTEDPPHPCNFVQVFLH